MSLICAVKVVFWPSLVLLDPHEDRSDAHTQNWVQEVENLIEGGGLESVTESVNSVTESKAEQIEDIRRIVERWGELLKSKSPRKQMCSLKKMN